MMNMTSPTARPLRLPDGSGIEACPEIRSDASSILSKLNVERRAQAAGFVAKHRLDRTGG